MDRNKFRKILKRNCGVIMTEKKCSNCLFCYIVKSPALNYICRRYPPVILEENKYYTVFPIVDGNSWCGEFLKRE